MSEMKHTPGPWAVRTLENFGFNVVHYIDGDKFDIARVAKCHDEANARFIASAPDLLDGAKKALEVAESWIHDQLDGTFAFDAAWEELDSVRAAIAKAEGRT